VTMHEIRARFPDTPEGRLAAAGYSRLGYLWLSPDLPPRAYTVDQALARIGTAPKKKGKK
jgi:hypothetical protein